MRIEGITALCDFLGCSHQAISEWQDQGMPVVERGGPNKPSAFDSAAVHKWLVERAVRAVKPESVRDRLALAQARNAEHDLAVKQGALVPVDLVEPRWSAAVVAAREQLLRCRRKLAAQLVGVKDVREIERVIEQEHDEYLRTLATWRHPEAKP